MSILFNANPSNNIIYVNKMFVNEIQVGATITEYLQNSSLTYEVVKVMNQGHIFVKELDQKTENNRSNSNDHSFNTTKFQTKELKKRYGYWNWVIRCDAKILEEKKKFFISMEKREEELKKRNNVFYQKTDISFD